MTNRRDKQTNGTGNPLLPLLFVCYATADKVVKEVIIPRLMSLVHRELLQLFIDYEIPPSANPKQLIKQALEDAQIAILLVSNNFFSSKAIAHDELPTLFKRQKEGTLKLFALQLDICDLSLEPRLEDIQFVGRKKVLSKFRKNGVDELLLELTNAIKKEVERLREAQLMPNNAQTVAESFRPFLLQDNIFPFGPSDDDDPRPTPPAGAALRNPTALRLVGPTFKGRRSDDPTSPSNATTQMLLLLGYTKADDPKRSAFAPRATFNPKPRSGSTRPRPEALMVIVQNGWGEPPYLIKGLIQPATNYNSGGNIVNIKELMSSYRKFGYTGHSQRGYAPFPTSDNPHQGGPRWSKSDTQVRPLPTRASTRPPGNILIIGVGGTGAIVLKHLREVLPARNVHTADLNSHGNALQSLLVQSRTLMKTASPPTVPLFFRNRPCIGNGVIAKMPTDLPHRDTAPWEKRVLFNGSSVDGVRPTLQVPTYHALFLQCMSILGVAMEATTPETFMNYPNGRAGAVAGKNARPERFLGIGAGGGDCQPFTRQAPFQEGGILLELYREGIHLRNTALQPDRIETMTSVLPGGTFIFQPECPFVPSADLYGRHESAWQSLLRLFMSIMEHERVTKAPPAKKWAHVMAAVVAGKKTMINHRAEAAGPERFLGISVGGGAHPLTRQAPSLQDWLLLVMYRAQATHLSNSAFSWDRAETVTHVLSGGTLIFQFEVQVVPSEVKAIEADGATRLNNPPVTISDAEPIQPTWNRNSHRFMYPTTRDMEEGLDSFSTSTYGQFPGQKPKPSFIGLVNTITDTAFLGAD